MADVQDIKFNPQFGSEGAATVGYADGWVRSLITDAEKTRSKEKPGEVSPQYHMLVLQLAPLADPEDLDTGVGRGVRTYCCLPFEPVEWEEKYSEAVVEELRGKLRMFLRMGNPLFHSLFPDEVPAWPRKNYDGDYEFNGEIIDGADFKAYERVASEATYAKMWELWTQGDVTDVEGQTLYHRIKAQPDSTFVSCDRFSPKHPEWDGELVELNTGAAVQTQVVPDLPEGYEPNYVTQSST